MLRAIYHDFYRRILARCRPGRTLEIGGGPGNLKSWLPNVISTDISLATWLDAVADAQTLPFSRASLDNIVMVDVLHHIPRPPLFFREAVRVLRPGGRVIMIEPGITPVSRIFYALFHDEPVRMNIDVLSDVPLSSASDPWDANQGIPTVLFRRQQSQFEAAFPDLRLVECQWLSLFAYPLSGGFKPWQLLPASWSATILGLEDRLMPVLGPLMAFRLMAVIERR